MRTPIWVLLFGVCIVTPRWSYAQTDPQVGYGLIGTTEFFNSVAEGAQNVCFDVAALKPPDPKLGHYVVRFSIYINPPEEGNYKEWKALRRLAIDKKEVLQLKEPSSYVGGAQQITLGICFRLPFPPVRESSWRW